jgi:hypothetical protein
MFFESLSEKSGDLSCLFTSGIVLANPKKEAACCDVEKR